MTKLCGEGMMARLIGLAISKTTSGVISVAHRIGLPVRPSPLRPPVEGRLDTSWCAAHKRIVWVKSRKTVA